MMRVMKTAAFIVLSISTLCAQTISVGSGAPTPGVTLTFEVAWERNGFSLLVGNPAANVMKFGSTGLILVR